MSKGAEKDRNLSSTEERKRVMILWDFGRQSNGMDDSEGRRRQMTSIRVCFFPFNGNEGFPLNVYVYSAVRFQRARETVFESI